MAKDQPSYFDIPYGIPSQILGLGATVVSTTGGDYLGMAITATSAGAVVLVYDNATTASGRLLDAQTFAANVATKIDSNFAVKARKGFTVSIINGTGASAVIFYSPKG